MQTPRQHVQQRADAVPAALTWDRVALHAGGLPGCPESHGCLHLPFAFAKALFETAGHATTVISWTTLASAFKCLT